MVAHVLLVAMPKRNVAVRIVCMSLNLVDMVIKDRFTGIFKISAISYDGIRL